MAKKINELLTEIEEDRINRFKSAKDVDEAKKQLELVKVIDDLRIRDEELDYKCGWKDQELKNEEEKKNKINPNILIPCVVTVAVPTILGVIEKSGSIIAPKFISLIPKIKIF